MIFCIHVTGWANEAAGNIRIKFNYFDSNGNFGEATTDDLSMDTVRSVLWTEVSEMDAIASALGVSVGNVRRR